MRWEPGICLADSATNPKCWHQNKGFFNKIDVKLPLRMTGGDVAVADCGPTSLPRLWNDRSGTLGVIP